MKFTKHGEQNKCGDVNCPKFVSLLFFEFLHWIGKFSFLISPSEQTQQTKETK